MDELIEAVKRNGSFAELLGVDYYASDEEIREALGDLTDGQRALIPVMDRLARESNGTVRDEAHYREMQAKRAEYFRMMDRFYTA